MTTAVVCAAAVPATIGAIDFDFSRFRIFTSIPEHRDFGIVALRGMVVIYDEGALHREGIIAGEFYVRESQRPRSSLRWETWLERERDDCRRRCGPSAPLEIRREVIQAIRWPNADDWSAQLPSGLVDGPFCSWAFGTDFIGKVVGVYLPAVARGDR